MKLLRYIFMFSSLAFLNQSMALENCPLQYQKLSSACCKTCCEYHLGMAAFVTSTQDLWYNLILPAYPDTVLLSKNRNNGFKQGGVRLQSTGIKILEPGNYWVSVKSVLQNPTNENILVVVLLGLNGAFNPDENALIGSVVSLQPADVGVAQGTGILENVPANTTLSLFAGNGTGQDPQLVNVIEWDINVSKIPCN
jgi:hypothetical protein